MRPGSISMLYFRKEKVLTLVSAFFVAKLHGVRFQQESLSVLHMKTKSGKGSIYSELCLSVLNHKMKSKILRGLSEKSGQQNVQ
jgi:hypothetical protein